MAQTFQDLSAQQFFDLPAFAGTSWVFLAEPVPQGSIHRLTIRLGPMGAFEET